MFLQSKEYNGFVWNTSRGISLKSDALLEKPKEGQKQFARRPYLGFFKVLFRFEYFTSEMCGHLKFLWNVIELYMQRCELSRFWQESYALLPRLPLSCFGT